MPLEPLGTRYGKGLEGSAFGRRWSYPADALAENECQLRHDRTRAACHSSKVGKWAYCNLEAEGGGLFVATTNPPMVVSGSKQMGHQRK